MIAGVLAVRRVYEKIDPRLKLVIVKEDGAVGEPGETVISFSGSTRSILTGERVALNFLRAPCRNRDAYGSVRSERTWHWSDDSGHAKDNPWSPRARESRCQSRQREKS